MSIIDKFYRLDENIHAHEEEFSVKTRYGETRVWTFGASPLGRLADGRRLVLSMALDITRRKKTEQELHEHKKSLEQLVIQRTKEVKQINELNEHILLTIPSAIVVIDKDFHILSTNRSFLELFHFKGKQVLGENFCLVVDCFFFDKNDQHQEHCWLKDAFKTIIHNSETPVEIENALRRKDGTKMAVKLYLSEMSLVQGRYLIVIENITKNKSLERELLQTERLAATGRLAASIAHEINNPLQGIVTHLEIIEKALPGNFKEMESCGFVKENFQRISDIVKKFLDIYRTSSDAKTTIDINVLIHKVVSLVDNQMHIKGIRLKLNLKKNIPRIIGWPQQLHQVVLNLLLNALESTPTGGKISVLTFLKDNLINIQIADTGKGIEEDEIEHIFDPFFSTKIKHGVGLGLFVCQGFIKNHSGHIIVDSRPREETVFTITLPKELPDG